MIRARPLGAAALVLAALQPPLSPGASVPSLPSSTLDVWTGHSWERWWNSESAPATWRAPSPILGKGLAWRRAAPGVDWAEARLAGAGEAKRVRLIVALLDPRLVTVRLDTARLLGGTRPGWTVAAAREDALLAVNTGQFPHSLPWGWVVMNGREYQAPGRGPLSVGVAFDSAGGVHWLPADSLALPSRSRGISVAFQSYPRLLNDGQIPVELQVEGRGVDLSHRDARGAIGQRADGCLVVAITRFDGAGGAFDYLPLGLTTPEMAAVMGGLGARDAVMLDGGISSQLMIRDGNRVVRWNGLRRVPLGLVVLPMREGAGGAGARIRSSAMPEAPGLGAK